MTALAVGASACGGGSGASATTSTADSTIQPASAATAPSTTALAAAAPSTLAPATIAPTDTTVATTVVGDGVPGQVGLEFGTAVAIADDHIVIMNLDGSGDAVITDYFAFGGAFPARPELHPDGRRAFFSVGYEEGWYDCDTVQGEVYGVALVAGAEPYLVGQGNNPRVSPDGRSLAYLQGSECLNAEDLTYATVLDTVVIVDLVQGGERVLRLPIAPQLEGPSIDDIGWDWSGALVYVVGRDVYRVFPDENVLSYGEPVSTLDLVAPDTAELDTAAPGFVEIAGVGREGRLVLVTTTFEDGIGESTVHNIDLVTGQVLGDFGTYPAWASVAFDGTGTSLIVSDSSAIYVDGLRIVADRQYDPAIEAYISGADY